MNVPATSETAVRDEPRFSPAWNPATVLLAEDDAAMRALLLFALRREGFSVYECANGVELARALGLDSDTRRSMNVDVIIADIRMPYISGLEILEAMQPASDWPPMILITAFGDEQTHADALGMGAADIFDKPLDASHLLRRVRALAPPMPPH